MEIKNNRSYLIGMVCLFISLVLFSYSAYILPYLMFNWQYSLPDFVLNWVHILKSNYHFSAFFTSLIVFLSFFTPGVVLMVIADVISNRLGQHLVVQADPIPDVASLRQNQSMSDGWKLSLKLIGVILLVIIFVKLLEWMIAK